MIVEMLTFLMILVMGGIAYVSLNETHIALLDALESALPAAFVNNYTGFNAALLYWLPAFIVVIALVTFFVMSLRKKENNIYGY